ncbi:hypothetical protein [Streptococcus ferus]|uniref:hypothetical protein n=1 Tax=Streptococcus ferus TaxID=1345 RepID=UPI00359FDB0D
MPDKAPYDNFCTRIQEKRACGANQIPCRYPDIASMVIQLITMEEEFASHTFLIKKNNYHSNEDYE